MNIQITDESIIKDIQEEFNRCFPYLKIELCRKGNRFGPEARKLPLLPGQRTFGSLHKMEVPRKLEINEDTVVCELEKQCEEQFGLLMQVYRKSGNMWIETTKTNNWTIGQQNEQGMQISHL